MCVCICMLCFFIEHLNNSSRFGYLYTKILKKNFLWYKIIFFLTATYEILKSYLSILWKIYIYHKNIQNTDPKSKFLFI